MDLLWVPALILIIYYACLLLGRALRQRLLRKQTCVDDIHILGSSRASADKIKGIAVVCGGSISGLLTARVCHDHFENVLIVEPEGWLDSDDAKRVDSWNQENIRSRVMQYDSLQGVQVFAYRGFCKLFPGFESECKASDINVCPGDFRTSTWGTWTMTPYSEYDGYLPKTMFASRRGLETLIRRLVLGSRYENIQQMTGTVTGVSRSTSNPQYLDQITIRTANGIRTIQASMVADCTGPACAGIKWLRREGFGIAAEYPRGKLPLDDLKIAYDQKTHYSTLHFHVPKEVGSRFPGLPTDYDDCGPIYNCTTDYTVDHRSIYAQHVEGNFVQVCCGAWGDVDLPQTLDEVKHYEVQDSMTCSRVRVPPTTYVRFEDAVNLPSNWVAIGDSVMRVNPVFGQGCTKALIGAVCLNTILVGVQTTVALPRKFSQMFFETQGAKIATSLAGDYGYETTIPVPGEHLSKGRFLRWYMRKLHILAFTDKQAGSSLWHVKMFLAPPIDNMQLGLVLKIAWNFIRDPWA
ncbi:uncharacterized protein EV420DRAFT_1698330 [Desarmillaria tabescens]|uniref:FAD/NAD(P)-binding domain-containing protein n=1 Tax=Armillaria tabescens TaxID=1929756 RepID=A0AA39T5Y6_ARMTA|nr:uncharacterized protein EV420DRAFT_1698330 [Desarmillaria tabescens]KAK0466721.1 hypothetical protein EV420DRAFT_1698330 [Desarmillaria tabescens]